MPEIPLTPLTGTLDTRSAPNELSQGAVRMRQNLRTISDGKLRRGNGWEKLLNSGSFNNEDFHDQCLVLTSHSIRQPATLLFEAESSRKTRLLILGQQTRLMILNENPGNWSNIGTGSFGGTPAVTANVPRFKAAQVGDYVVFTNDFDKPRYHILETNDQNNQSLLSTLPDLDLIGMTRAKCVWSWRNCIFFADVEMDQTRFAHRIVWSDYNNPISFDPSLLNSIAGEKDLNSNERILAGAPAGNSFLIYTTHGIWQMDAVGGDQSFAFRRVYNGESNEGSAVLKYPNTLVSLPDAHVYMAEDGVYFFSQYYGKPERAEWLHRSTSVLYDNINDQNCDAHIATYNGNEVLFSVARKSAPNGFPDITLRVNLTYKAADVIDHGFTAFCNYRSFNAPRIEDFIVSEGICTLHNMILKFITAFGAWTLEGLAKPLPTSSAAFTPTVFYTHTTKTVDGIVVEDWDQAEADADSLCALLGNLTLDDLCRKCDGPTLLVASSSIDWCLKQLTDVFYRERCVNPTATGTLTVDGYISSVGSYILDGYDSILRSAPLYGGKAFMKCSEFRLDYLAEAQTTPTLAGLQVGISAQPADPNVLGCGIVWYQHSLKPLKCLSNKTQTQHLADGTQPSEYHKWNFFRRGRVLYFEVKVSGTGGDALFTGVVADNEQEPAHGY